MLEVDKVRTDIAYKYYEFHAKDRTAMFQYFSAFVPILFAAYFYLLKEKPVAFTAASEIALSAFGVAVSIAFILFDVRNQQLADIAVHHLCVIEAKHLYSKKDEFHPHLDGVFNAVRSANIRMFGLAKATLVVRSIYGLAAIGFLLCGLYALR